MQDRARSYARSIGGAELLLHRWRDGAHRVLIANFGAALALQAGEIEVGFDVDPAQWTVLLSTTEIDFEERGTGERVQHYISGAEIRVPARSAVVFGFSQSCTPTTPRANRLPGKFSRGRIRKTGGR
jgi:hypothetical protein